jgi:hypothetical protein
MKKMLLIALSLFCAQMIYAQRVSHVTIYCEEHYKFTVYLNGEKKNDQPQENVRIINLTQPYYKLRIEFEDVTLNAIERKIFQLTNSTGGPVDAVHIIKLNKKGEMVMHWKSQTEYPPYIETNKPTVVVVQGGTAVQQTTTTRTETTEAGGTHVSFGVPGGSVSFNTGDGGAPVKEKTTTTTVVSGGAVAAVTTTPCQGTIPGEDDFNDALKSIAARSTEDGKLLSAKQIISSNCLTCAEVKKIMGLFTTEESKLAVAKFAYPHTVDQGSYYKVNSEFKNESSIDELNKAIVK